MNYETICRIAKKEGVMPDCNVSSKNIDVLKGIETVCLKCYHKRPEDAEFIGSYFYYQSEQPGGLKYADAVCSITEDNRAVIGVSHELMNCGSKQFCEIVFLHELAHLTEIEHNENFMDRFNELEYEYFMKIRRADGRKTLKPTSKPHRW